MPELYSNDPSTTLNGTINNSVTALTVTSPTGFPGAGNFRIRIDSELMLVTAVAGSVFTVTRGIEGTSAASHTSGATINHFLTADALGQVLKDRIYTNTVSALPTASLEGRTFLPTDGGYILHDNGTSWNNTGNKYFAGTLPPAASTLTTSINASTLTLTDENDGMLVTLVGNGGTSEDLAAKLKAYPTSSFSFVVGIDILYCHPTAYTYGGIGVSNGTAVIVHGFIVSPGGFSFNAAKYNSSSSYNANYGTLSSVPTTPATSGRFYLKWSDDLSTTRNLQISMDGKHWYEQPGMQGGLSRTEFLTPTHIGIAAGQSTNSASASYPRLAMKVFHWSGI